MSGRAGGDLEGCGQSQSGFTACCVGTEAGSGFKAGGAGCRWLDMSPRRLAKSRIPGLNMSGGN